MTATMAMVETATVMAMVMAMVTVMAMMLPLPPVVRMSVRRHSRMTIGGRQ
jgi:hypothetical protein